MARMRLILVVLILSSMVCTASAAGSPADLGPLDEPLSPCATPVCDDPDCEPYTWPVMDFADQLGFVPTTSSCLCGDTPQYRGQGAMVLPHASGDADAALEDVALEAQVALDVPEWPSPVPNTVVCLHARGAADEAMPLGRTGFGLYAVDLTYETDDQLNGQATLEAVFDVPVLGDPFVDIIGDAWVALESPYTVTLSADDVTLAGFDEAHSDVAWDPFWGLAGWLTATSASREVSTTAHIWQDAQGEGHAEGAGTGRVWINRGQLSSWNEAWGEHDLPQLPPVRIEAAHGLMLGSAGYYDREGACRCEPGWHGWLTMGIADVITPTIRFRLSDHGVDSASINWNIGWRPITGTLEADGSTAFDLTGHEKAILAVAPEVDLERVSLVAPDGTTRSLADSGTLLGDEGRSVALVEPEDGVWRLWTDQPGLGAVVDVTEPYMIPAPTLHSVSASPTDPGTGDPLTIAWDVSTPVSRTTLSLYYERVPLLHSDTWPVGLQAGRMITGCIDVETGVGQYVWDTSDLMWGDYRLYARLDDGRNAPVVRYIDETIEVRDRRLPWPASSITATQVGDAIRVTWDRSPDLGVCEYRLVTGQSLDVDDLAFDLGDANISWIPAHADAAYVAVEAINGFGEARSEVVQVVGFDPPMTPSPMPTITLTPTVTDTPTPAPTLPTIAPPTSTPTVGVYGVALPLVFK